jgi:hypothetical protein
MLLISPLVKVFFLFAKLITLASSSSSLVNLFDGDVVQQDKTTRIIGGQEVKRGALVFLS